MEFYKCKMVQANFENICDKINIGLFNSGFRILIENNLQNQIILELGVTTKKWKILGAADFPIDLTDKNPFDGRGNIIYFKLMIFEIHKNLFQISAIEPIHQPEFLLNARYKLLLFEVKKRISNIMDHILEEQYNNSEDNKLEEYYFQ